MKSFPAIWKRLLKIVGVTVLVVFILFALASWLLFRQRNSLVLEEIQSYMQQSQSGQLTIGAIDLRIFRSFPDISIELDSIVYFERHDSLRTPGEAAIVRAERVYVALAMWPLFNNKVEVSAIEISGGRIHLLEYSPGVFNIHRALAKPVVKPPDTLVARTPVQRPSVPQTDTLQKPKPKTAAQRESNTRIELENVTMSDVRLSWLPLGQDQFNSILVKNFEAGWQPDNTDAEIYLESNYQVDTLVIDDFEFPATELSFIVEGRYDKARQLAEFQEILFSLDAFTLTASGTYDHQKGNMDLALDASSNDVQLLESILRPEVIRDNQDLLRSGDMYLRGRLFGEPKHPKFDVAFGASKFSFKLPGAKGSFTDLGFEGSMKSGDATDYTEASIQITKLKGEVPGGFVSGEIGISNFSRPWLYANISAQFALDGFDKVFRLGRVSELAGTANARLQFDGPLGLPWPGRPGARAKFDGEFAVSGLSFLLTNNNQRINEANCKGTFSSGDKPDQSAAVIDITELSAVVPGGKIQGSIRMTNLAKPFVRYRLSANVDIAGYDQLLQAHAIQNLRGRAKAELGFDGPIALIGTHAMDSSRSSVLQLDSVSFAFRKGGKEVSGMRARMVHKNNIADLELAFRCGDSDLQLEAKAENLAHRFFGNERIVKASGQVRSRQFFTRDAMLDTLVLPVVDERVSDLSFGFDLENILAREDTVTGLKQFAFEIRKLSGKLDQLADIRNLDARGEFLLTPGQVSMNLNEFVMTLPQGNVSISGNMLIPERRQINAQARIRLNQFPWDYASDLIAEIRDDSDPSRKNLPEGELVRLTGEIEAEALMRTYPFDFHKLEIRNSRLRCEGPGSKPYGADLINVSLRPFYFLHPENSGAITGLRSIRGTCQLKGIQIPGMSGINASFSVTGISDSLRIEFEGGPQNSNRDNGFITMNLAPEEPVYQLHYEVPSVRAEDLVKRYSKKQFLSGDIGFTLDATTRGSTWTAAGTNMKGTVNVHSDSLALSGMDIDDALAKFEKSQKFNLTDLGAVVLVGPIGLVATKGTDFVALAGVGVDSKKRTHIKQLLANWKLENHVLQTTDVAFATPKNRIAFDGAIDLGRDSIPGIRVAVVDKNGCSLMDQHLYGKFSNIQTGKLNIAKTLLGSVINFVDAIVGKDCVVVYQGMVKDPNSGKQ